MKLLINSDSKIIRVGEFITADAETESILDTEDHNATKAHLIDICETTEIGHGGKDKVSVLIGKIEKFVEDSKIPTQDEPTKTQKLQLVVDEHKETLADMMKKNNDQNLCLVYLVNQGVIFRDCGKILRLCLEDTGLLISSAEKLTKVAAFLSENDAEDELKDWASVEELISAVDDEFDSVDKKFALRAIRSWAKKNEFTVPKKKKTKKVNWRQAMKNFIASNLDCTDEDITEQLEELGKDGDKIKPYVALRTFGNLVLEALEDDEDDEAEAA